MTDRNPDPSPSTHDWDTYWRGSRDSAAYASGGVSHPAAKRFWLDFFGSVGDQPKIVDFASGNGAVLEAAQEAFSGRMPEFCCIDSSAAAIESLQSRFAGVRGVVADAGAVPLEADSYDIATSQFGVEYAGLEALDEMIRLLAPGGHLALLLHHRDGGIFRECSASQDAIEKLRRSDFIPLSSKMFEEGFAVCRGAPPEKYNAATRKVLAVCPDLDAILQQYGRHVAGETISRLYSDVMKIQDRIQYHDPDEVVSWLKRMDEEVEAYAGRMASQCAAAIDAAAFAEIGDRIGQAGFLLERNDALLVPDHELPLAWALIAARR